MPATYNTLYLDTRKRLKQAGIESPQLEAKELVCLAAGKSRDRFYQDLPLYASGAVEKKLEELVRRRLTGEPVAYLIGAWEFYGLTLTVNRDVLIPRIDTELLAERAILLARTAGPGARILDLCAGSGCVGLAIAANVPGCHVVLADLSESALAVCRENVRRHGLESQVTWIRADALDAPPGGLGEFDVIACNPPYIPSGDIQRLDVSVRDFEPRAALDGGADGLAFYRAVCAKWAGALRMGGSLLFEVGIGQSADVEVLLAGNGFEHIRAWQDTQGIWRAVGGTIPIRNIFG